MWMCRGGYEVMKRLFGTDGVRGLANKTLDCGLAYRLGQAGAYVLNRSKGDRIKILIGKDTRISGDMLEAALIAGMCSVGADVVPIGIIPTPAIAHLVRCYEMDAGVMISASHNPMEYNGIKFFDKNGYKLPDEVEDEIEGLIKDGLADIELPMGENVGRRLEYKNAVKDYIEFLKNTIDTRLDGLKVALDCANGAAYVVAPTVFRELGAEVFIINDTPNGVNINANCGSTHPERLQEYVLEVGADVGLAFDGDADRLIAVDEQGSIVDGDHIMAICGLDLKQRGMLSKNTVVATVMSNLGLDIALNKNGCSVVKTKVGDRYVLESMLKEGYNFGGEQSGHIIFFDHNTTGDGCVTALQLVSIMQKRQQKLSTLANAMKKLPQVLVNVEADEDMKHNYINDNSIQSAIREIEEKLKGNGRVLVRPSGTEPLIRIMIEGENHDEIEKYANSLATLFKK